VARFLIGLDASNDSTISADPLRVALVMTDEIEKRYRAQGVSYELAGEKLLLSPADVVWRVPVDFVEPAERVPISSW
jgi:hypothetical protein